MIDFGPDFREFLCCLADAGVEFVVVGGYAMAFHGLPRATKDLDVLVRPTSDNAVRVYQALAEFGAPLDHFEVAVGDFAEYGGVLQMGVPPNRIDIITRIDGVTFSEAISERGDAEVEGRTVPFIGREALLKNKRASGRPQDLLDVETLERAPTQA